MFPDISGGAGGLSANSSANSRSGQARGSSGGNQFTFSFGGNPNVKSNDYLMYGGLAIAGFLLWKKFK